MGLKLNQTSKLLPPYANVGFCVHDLGFLEEPKVLLVSQLKPFIAHMEWSSYPKNVQ